MCHGLRGIQHGERARLRCQGQQVFIRGALAGRVGAGSDRENPRARCQQAGQVVGVQTALRIGQQDAQGGSAAPCNLLPWHQIGVVFQATDDDFVPRAQPRWARATGPEPLGHQVQRFGGARRKDQFMRRACADETLQIAARLFKGVGGALAQGVHAAMDIGAVFLLEMAHGRQYLQRHLCGGSVVEVGQCAALNALLQHRKQVAQAMHHGISCQRRCLRKLQITHGASPTAARWCAPASHRPSGWPACPGRRSSVPTGPWPCLQ